MSSSPGSGEIEQTIYTVFSIVSSYSIQLKLQIVPQSDLKAVIAVTGFLASLMFLALSWARPEERIITAKVKKFLRSDPEFLQFLVGAEVLFRGWDYTRFALIHSWRGQLSDRVEQLPENPASVPSNMSRVVFYNMILVFLFGSIIYEIDVIMLLIGLVAVVALDVILLRQGDFVLSLLFRHLVEFDVLKDYVAALNQLDGHPLQLPEVRIVYEDKREKIQEQKQKAVVLGLSTLRELISQLERLLLRKRWGRFEFMFRQFEPIFTLYMKEVISGRGISDLIVAWSRAIVDDEHRAVSKHIVSRVQEAYRAWSQITKTKHMVAELEVLDKENFTPTKFFETLSVKELTMDAGIAASRVLEMLAEKSDIRTPSIIGSILDGIEVHGSTIIDDYVERLINRFVESPDYLEHVFSKTLRAWDREGVVSEGKAVQLLMEILRNPEIGGNARRSILQDIRSFSDSAFNNPNWDIYKDYLGYRLQPLLPLMVTLLALLERNDIAEVHDRILDILLNYSPVELWNHIESHGIQMAINKHISSASNETEVSLLGALRSPKERVLIEALSEMKRLGSKTTPKLAAAVVDMLFSTSSRVRVAAARSLLLMASCIQDGSPLHSRMLCALDDPESIVRKSVISLNDRIQSTGKKSE